MTEFTVSNSASQEFEVHNSKLTYATIKRMVALITEYMDMKEVLAYYFPEVDNDNTE